MYQVIETTDKEKFKMYKKLKKKQLIEMLIQANKIIAAQPKFTYTTNDSKYQVS